MRHLLVAFAPEEVGLAAGFAAALGLPWDVLLVTGASGQGPQGGSVLTCGYDAIPTATHVARPLAEFVAGRYSHVSAVSSMAAKDLLARAAGHSEAAMVTDALAVESADVFTRAVVAGSVLVRVRVLADLCYITFRPSAFPPAELGDAETVPKDLGLDASGVELLAETTRSGGRPDLTQAKVVVSGGRPLGDAETFERLIGGLADKLGGAVGATRAAVDTGIAANELQVGQTGKVVAPDLYIAAGISGSTQHMAGIKDSKCIVAINKDPDAPIFDVADLGIVGDLFEIVPALIDRV